eukprot:1569389-Pyramimonas_sp.AAC.1
MRVVLHKGQTSTIFALQTPQPAVPVQRPSSDGPCFTRPFRGSLAVGPHVMRRRLLIRRPSPDVPRPKVLICRPLARSLAWCIRSGASQAQR